jgi:hypothetical protein
MYGQLLDYFQYLSSVSAGAGVMIDARWMFACGAG